MAHVRGPSAEPAGHLQHYRPRSQVVGPQRLGCPGAAAMFGCATPAHVVRSRRASGAPGIAVPSGDDGHGSSRSTSRTASELSPDRAAGTLRAVVVEDEAIILMEIESLLAAAGIEVVGAASGADEAVRLADMQRPDFLTMDINLPRGRDGISAAAEIYERFGIRCMFVSAYSDPETVGRAMAARPLAWLAKPVTRQRLEAALRLVRTNLGDA